MVASADLGGLGAKDGPPVVFAWHAPNPIPFMLPWLALLGLLAPRPNRQRSAWWIFAPSAGLWILCSVVGASQTFLPSSTMDGFLCLTRALGFGMAGAWLVGGLLARAHRFLIFLGTTGTMAVLGGVGLVGVQGLEGLGAETMAFGVAILAVALVLSAALGLAGWSCRGCYGPGRVLARFAGILAVAWLCVLAPLLLLTVLMGNGGPVLALVGGAWLAAMLVSLGVSLPFFVLSFANSFYKERLKQLLRLDMEPPPPGVPPPLAGAVEVESGSGMSL